MLCFKNCSICPCSVRHPLGNPQRRRPSGQNYWRPRQGLGHLVKRQSYYMHLLLLGADLITKLDFGQFRYFWWDVMRPCSLQDGENCLTCTAINNLSDSLETRLTSRISPVSFHATCPSPPMGPVTRYKDKCADSIIAVRGESCHCADCMRPRLDRS